MISFYHDARNRSMEPDFDPEILRQQLKVPTGKVMSFCNRFFAIAFKKCACITITKNGCDSVGIFVIYQAFEDCGSMV